MMNTTTQNREPVKTTSPQRLCWLIIILLSIALAALFFIPGEWGQQNGPAPYFTGKIISIVPATAQQKAQDSTVLGTVLLQGDNGYQLLLTAHHATGDGCAGNDNTLHLSDIHVGQTVTIRYWLDQPETASNPHKGHIVYINDRC